jgi:hypothetical protein
LNGRTTSTRAEAARPWGECCVTGLLVGRAWHLVLTNRRTGTDCTALPGVSSVGCSAGACHGESVVGRDHISIRPTDFISLLLHHGLYAFRKQYDVSAWTYQRLDVTRETPVSKCPSRLGSLSFVSSLSIGQLRVLLHRRDSSVLRVPSTMSPFRVCSYPVACRGAGVMTTGPRIFTHLSPQSTLSSC